MMVVSKIIHYSGCIPPVTGLIPRVSSLSDVAKTASYIDAGDVYVLKKALKFMAKYRIACNVVDENARLVVASLYSFAGQYKACTL